MDDGLDPRFLVGVTRRARIADVDRAGAILLWGPDLKEELGTSTYGCGGRLRSGEFR